MDKPERLYDVRTLRRHIDMGDLTQAEYDSRLADLEDCTELATQTEVQFVHRAPEDDDDA